MKQSHLKAIAATAAKAAVSAALIAFALRGVEARTVVEHLRAVDAGAVVAAIVIVTAIATLHARRWEIVLARMEHALPYAEALKLVLIGYFFNQTLPSTIGGDAYRAWGAYKRGIHAGNAITSVLVDRILGLMTLVAMTAAGAWWLVPLVRSATARWAIALVLVAGAAGFVALLALARFAAMLRRWRVTRMLVHVSDGARAVVASGGATLQVGLLTVAGFAALSFSVYVLARGLGVELSLGHALLFVPLVSLVTVLPVSIAGWGLRESAMVVALGLIGVPSAQAFSLSVLNGLVVMASGVPGGILWLAARRARAGVAPAAAQNHGTP